MKCLPALGQVLVKSFFYQMNQQRGLQKASSTVHPSHLPNILLRKGLMTPSRKRRVCLYSCTSRAVWSPISSLFISLASARKPHLRKRQQKEERRGIRDAWVRNTLVALVSLRLLGYMYILQQRQIPAEKRVDPQLANEPHGRAEPIEPSNDSSKKLTSESYRPKAPIMPSK